MESDTLTEPAGGMRVRPVSAGHRSHRVRNREAVSAVSAKPESRIAVLDGLRFVAALGVVLHHYVGTGGWHGVAWGRPATAVFPTFSKVAAYGFLGVNLFFLISGFVICMSAWGRSPGEFVISRIARLFPVYWIGVAATTTVFYLHEKPMGRPEMGSVLTNLTMLQSGVGVDGVDGVYWTLWFELVFYLLMVTMLFIGIDYRRMILFCSVWTVASVLSDMSGAQSLQILTMPEYSPYFIAGICFFLIHRFGSNLILWGMVVLQWLLAQHEIGPQTASLDGVVNRQLASWPAVLGMTVAFLLIAAVALGWLSRVRGRYLVVLGSISYPLYLLHQGIGWTVIYTLHKRVSPIPLVLGLTLAIILVAWAIARFVEKPLSALLRRHLRSAVASISAASASGSRGASSLAE